MEKKQYVQGALFEEDYLKRTLGNLAHSPEVAITELVANAWDAGATIVDIFIPDKHDELLIIEDNGTGLTKEEFYNRWMRLGYNRLKYQGKNVVFPGKSDGKRLAYGRNGVGRHGLLCFNSEYKVITSSKGNQSTFVITTRNEKEPFVIKDESFKKSSKHGTRLEVSVTEHLPDAENILKIISAKFLHDPNFKISINKKSVLLEEHSGLLNSRPLKIGNVNLMAHFIDSHKRGRSTIYQGIAFWQSNRLVGEPSWFLGNDIIIDGRTTFAKRYTVVIKTNDLGDYILEDWSGFKKVKELEPVYKEVGKYVNEMFSSVAKENIQETKAQIKKEHERDFSSLSQLGKYKVSEAIDNITYLHPTARPEAISLAVEAIINIEKSSSGKELLLKLANLSLDDIKGLNDILDKWTIRDALTVLDEIDNRLSVIEAIRKLSGDKDVDELHVLHPLVTNARWLFGPEFESAEYSSNKQLQTAVEQVFNKKINKGVFNNPRKRPDIVVLPESTLSVTGTECFDNESELSVVNKVLIIELKKGGYKLTRGERNQATGYVEDFMSCGSLIGSPYIEAFVIGETFNEKVQPISTVKNSNDIERGKIRIATYGQLVDTAEKRLFGLRQKLSERYDEIPGMDLFRKQSVQMDMGFYAEGTNG